MKAAVIDCGTNTFHLLVAGYDSEGNVSILMDEKRNVKLGEEFLVHNKIGPRPFERGLKEFSELIDLARGFQPDIIKAFATSAIRGSSNGKEFVEQVFKTSGILIDIIDGQREALLIFKGVRMALGTIPGISLIMDIGGGSTEFILTSNSQIIWKHSFDLGVSRLLQKFRPSDPVNAQDLTRIEGFFTESLEPLARELAIHSPTLLIGCSGSFESLASMIQEQIYNQPLDNFIKSYTFREKDFEFIHGKLLESNEGQRMKMAGLVEARVDTIVFATAFIAYIRKRFGITNMVFSNYALKEGAFSELLD